MYSAAGTKFPEGRTLFVARLKNGIAKIKADC